MRCLPFVAASLLLCLPAMRASTEHGKDEKEKSLPDVKPESEKSGEKKSSDGGKPEKSTVVISEDVKTDKEKSPADGKAEKEKGFSDGNPESAKSGEKKSSDGKLDGGKPEKSTVVISEGVKTDKEKSPADRTSLKKESLSGEKSGEVNSSVGKSSGGISEGGKSGEEKASGGQGVGGKPKGGKSGEKKSSGGMSSGGLSGEENSSGDKSSGGISEGGKSGEEKASGGQSAGGKPKGGKSGEKKSSGGMSSGGLSGEDNSSGDKSSGGISEGGKSGEEKASGGQSAGGKPKGGKSGEKKSSGGISSGGLSGEENSSGGKSSGGISEGGKSGEEKASGEQSVGGKPKGGKSGEQKSSGGISSGGLSGEENSSSGKSSGGISEGGNSGEEKAGVGGKAKFGKSGEQKSSGGISTGGKEPSGKKKSPEGQLVEGKPKDGKYVEEKFPDINVPGGKPDAGKTGKEPSGGLPSGRKTEDGNHPEEKSVGKYPPGAKVDGEKLGKQKPSAGQVPPDKSDDAKEKKFSPDKEVIVTKAPLPPITIDERPLQQPKPLTPLQQLPVRPPSPPITAMPVRPPPPPEPMPVRPPKPLGPVDECLRDSAGINYWGTRNYTASGKPCQPWYSMTPHPHPYRKILEGDENFCRNVPLLYHNPSYKPWCYVNDPYTLKEFCDIPICGEEDKPKPKPPKDVGCYKHDAAGREYQGPAFVSQSGRLCRKWNSLNRGYSYDDNFCRNPYGMKKKPWCYTEDPETDWEYCGIPICNFPPSKVNDTCSVTQTTTGCSTVKIITGDCFYSSSFEGECRYVVVMIDANTARVHIGDTKIVEINSSNKREYVDCASFKFDYKKVTVREPTCGWCMRQSWTNMIKSVKDNTCPAP